MATLGTTPKARVRETSTDTGTGNFVLAGAKENTEQAFLGAYGGGTSNVPYVIVNLDAAEWEEGLATVQDDGTGSSEIVRGGSQTVTASSNGGSAVSFSAGDKDVFSPLSGEQAQALFDHVVSTANPHGVTAAQIGLGNVPNEDATNPANWDPANTDGNFLVGDGTTFVAESGATARASLGLGTQATNDQHIATSSQNTNNGDITYVV